jgi:tryptophan-rich sensory protein
LNEIFALHTRRVIAGREFRIPNVIWIVLYAITALAAASIGYHSGFTGRSRPLVALAIILAFSAVILLIEDLDRPGHGFLNVSQGALVDLQKKMSAQIR